MTNVSPFTFLVIYCIKYVKLFFVFTLRPAYKRIGRWNLVLRPQFQCSMKLKATLCLPEQENDNNLNITIPPAGRRRCGGRARRRPAAAPPCGPPRGPSTPQHLLVLRFILVNIFLRNCIIYHFRYFKFTRLLSIHCLILYIFL